MRSKRSKSLNQTLGRQKLTFSNSWERSGMEISLGARHDFLRRYPVPQDWTRSELRKLAEIVGGATPSREEGRYWSGGKIPWATPTDLTSNNSKYIDKT